MGPGGLFMVNAKKYGESVMKSERHRPFLYVGGSFGLGIFLSRFIHVPLSGLCLLTVGFLIFGAGFSKWKILSTVFLLMAIIGLGAAYTQSREYVANDDIEYVARYYRKKPITIEGIIVSDIQNRRAANGNKTTFTLDIIQVKAKWGWQKRTGKVLVNVFGDTNSSYGDHIILEGKLHRPYNFSSGKSFSYREYLSRRGIRFILSVKKDAEVKILERDKGNYFKALSLRLRDRLSAILSENLLPNEAGIMNAILLGDRSGISKPIRALFVQTGTAHILAISGLHIGIVAALFLVFAKIMPIGRRRQLAVVILLIVSYAFLTGARPSVVRATVMTSVFLASFIIEKEFDMLNTLCLAGVIILLFNPLNLFDVGFQLSFSCVFAIIYADLSMRKIGLRRFWRKGDASEGRPLQEWVYYVLQSLYLSFVIWIAVVGLIAYYFGIITPITIFANVIVIPLISIIVVLGFGLLSIGLILPVWASMFALCLKVILNIMVGLIFLCDKVPFAYIYIREISVWHIMAYYAVVFLAIFIPWRFLWYNLRMRSVKIFKLGGIDKQGRV